MTMKPRFAASWQALQAAVSLSNAAVNFAKSRALMAVCAENLVRLI